VTLGEQARRLLVAGAIGASIDHAEAESLARAWLSAIGGDAALRVLDGGSLEARAIAELCDEIVRVATAQACVGARQGGAR
jgi:hypothetical protein